LRQINIQRGKLSFFKLDDKSTSIDVTVDEAVFNANKHLIKDDQLVILMVKAQPDRFSGGLRIQVQQAWDLAGARCRFGKYMQINVNGKLPDLDRILKDHPARVESTENGNLIRGLLVRFQLVRDGAQAQLDLGEAAKFFPTDAALATWTSQAHQGQAQIIYD